MSKTIKFTLPIGLEGPNGEIYRDGEMRKATARDEIEAAGDRRVKSNPAYVVAIVLARVLNKLGDLKGEEITPDLVLDLTKEDAQYLQQLYNEFNGGNQETKCPVCGTAVPINL